MTELRRSTRPRKSLNPSNAFNTTTPTRSQKDNSFAIVIDDDAQSPCKKPQSVKRNNDIPTPKVSEPGAEKEKEEETTDAYENEGPSPSVLDATSRYTLNHIVRAHSANHLGETDEKTQVWYSAFEPSSSILATCGGKTICFIDCDIGKVVAKYTHLEDIEEFYCLAWIRVLVNNKERENVSMKCNVLAAAGRLATVRLINTVQQTCYAYLRGHSDSVRMVKFSRKNNRHLFSASDDKTIRLWDIGSMNTSEENADSTCLALFSADDKIYSMCFSVAEDSLICGTHKGLIHQYTIPKTSNNLRESLPNENANPEKDNDTKSVRIRPEETYSSSSSSIPWHKTALDDMECIRFPSSKNSDAECWITKSVDGNFFCWRNSKPDRRRSNQPVSSPPSSFSSQPGEVILAIRTETNEKSFMRFSVSSNRRETSLLVGNSEGEVLIYSIGEHLRRSVQGDDLVMPHKTLCHEQSDGCIRRVCISDDHSKIVAVDHRNRIFIWERGEST